MRPFLSAILLLLLVVSPARAQQADIGDAVADMQAVLETQQRRFDAVTRGDLAALDSLMAPNLVYTHSTGQVDTKETFLGSLRSGAVKYVSIEPTDVSIQLFTDAAVITGVADLQLVVGGKDLAVTLRFTEVYARWEQDEPWQLVAWQSTRVPEGEK